MYCRETDKQRDTERQRERLQLPSAESEQTSGLCLSSHGQRYLFFAFLFPTPSQFLALFQNKFSNWSLVYFSENNFFNYFSVNKFVPVPKKNRKEFLLEEKNRKDTQWCSETRRSGFAHKKWVLRYYFRVDSVCYCSQPHMILWWFPHTVELLAQIQSSGRKIHILERVYHEQKVTVVWEHIN